SISGARWIEHVLQWKRRREEDRFLGEHECAVFTLFDDDVSRAARHYPLRRLNEIRLFGELTCFRVVQSYKIHLLEQLENIGSPALDPEVHRIARDQLRPSHLSQQL